MTEVEKHAAYIIDHTDIAVMAYREQDSDNLDVLTNCVYSEFIALTAYLIWNAHTKSGAPLEKIGADLNKAVKFVKFLGEKQRGDNE